MQKPTHDLKHIRRQKCARAEGMAWLAFVLLNLVFGLLMMDRAMASELPEVESGNLLFRDDNGQYRQAMHLESSASLQINGMIAKVELTQKFENRSQGWQEAVYVFPLPETAAVNYMEMQIGDRVIVGEIKEKNVARKIYQQAKAAGKKASLVEQQRPNLFTQKVANIAPGENISVTLRYIQRVEYDNGTFSLRFPMTLTPRYMPGAPLLANARAPEKDAQGSDAQGRDAQGRDIVAFNPLGWATPTAEVTDADLISPYMSQATNAGKDISMDIKLNAGLPLANIGALYHQIRISRNQGGHHIALQNGRVPLDRDFVLQWRPTNSSAPQAAVFKENIGNEDYILVMLLPPQQALQSREARLPRDMVFVIDTSGSMQGDSIVQARESLALALARLRPEDRFNVIEFNSSYSRLFPQPQTADTHNIQQAINWVSRLQADGGTEMHGALQAALSQMQQSARLKQLVFITDGAVGNETALFKLIHQYLGDTRLFTVGIGSAPNSYFMRKAAEFGRGSFTHIGSSREVKSNMQALFKKLESAVVSHINVQWPVAVESYPQKIPDLYAGEPLLLAAKTPAAQGSVQFDGFTAAEAWSKTLSLDEDNNSEGIASVWARAKVTELEDEKIRGRDAEEVRQAVLEVALLHNLVTAYTSFVAVEKQISRPAQDPLASSPVPNLVARGQQAQPQTLNYPQSATSAELSFVLGFLSLVTWIIFCLVRRISA